MRASYTGLLMRTALSAAMTRPKLFASHAATMFLNDLMFFLLWLIFFARTPSIAGWGLADIAALLGMFTVGFGLCFYLAAGANRMAGRIVSGQMDVYLTRPRHPLPQLLTLDSEASALGDIAYGLLLLLFVAHLGAGELALALVISVLIGALFLTVCVITQSLAFFTTGGSALAEQLFNMMMCIGTVPQHMNGMAVKLILFTVIPAGFMTILPVSILHRHDPVLLAAMAAAVCVYSMIAIAIFNRGLRRYTSATGWSA